MKILINKIKELIKIDEQLKTPKDNYSWTKQQGVLITSREAEQIVNYYAQFKDFVYCPECNGKGWTIPTDRVPYDCEKRNGTGIITFWL